MFCLIKNGPKFTRKAILSSDDNIMCFGILVASPGDDEVSAKLNKNTFNDLHMCNL